VKERSVFLFEEGISSKASLKTYKFGLNRFTNYYKLKSGDALLTIEPKKLQVMIEDYVSDLKILVSPNSISTYMKGVEHFFVMNDFILNWKKIHKLYPDTIKKAGGNAYTTQDIQNMLKLAKNLKLIALIHVLASTGARIGAIPELKLKHMKDLTDGCKTILFYPDSKFEYHGFLTPEASKAIDNYFDQRKRDGEYLIQDSPLFRAKYVIGSLKAKHCTVGSLKNLVRKIVSKSVTREKIGRRHNKDMNHSFRKRFNTILKNNISANRSLSEKLMSHEVKAIPLDSTYHDPDIDVLFNEFKKHISNLTIDDKQRLEEENKIKDETIKKMETEKDILINDYGERLSNSEKIIKDLAKRLDMKVE
jgi:integrase/recombinase XerD